MISGVRPRAVMAGIPLAVLICAATPFNNIYKQATPLGGGHFPLAPFFILAWLTLAAAGYEKWFKRKLFTGRELLVIWGFMILTSGIAYTGLARTFFITLTAPFHFATVENAWGEVLHPLLPSTWYPRNAAAVDLFYNGVEGGRGMSWLRVLGEIPWEVWTGPLLVWVGFILLCYLVMICMVNGISRQWIHTERMNFPLLRMPQLVEEAVDREGLSRFFSDRFLWMGIGAPVLLHLINGFHFYFPDIPRIPTLILAGPYFPTSGLLSGFTKLKIYIYPAFIGFAFLTTRQISFSFWLFFILGGLLHGFLGLLGYAIPAASLGVTFGPTLSRPEETQMIGAYGVFFLFILWLARFHLIQVLRQAFGKGSRTVCETEWFSPVLSFWGAFLGVLGLIAWLWYFGMPLLSAALMVGACFMCLLVASRVICQGGIAYFTLTMAPLDGLLVFFGPQFFTKAGLIVAAVMQKMLFLDLRESLMPSLIHTGKITQSAENRRMLFAALVGALVLCVGVSLIAMLALCHKYGARSLPLEWETGTVTNLYANLQTLIESPVRAGKWVWIFTAVGALVMSVLVICYHRFFWWPLHPIGYLTAYSSAMWILWFSFFIGWMLNALCMRYGGVSLFARVRFFFIGLIIGDFMMGGLWAVVGLFGDAAYAVLPG